uniref:Sugar phosphate transporter domain-containing protein n=1 Tax=Trieres chinensis TaxID=1514140 RepID=A0A7S2EHY8_TRICV|mmetsp:Transcript_23815/g.48219  ORF Transcript_23815/g.48219 Transcript_23815/m.48219 type:complete len:430 (+) Transcript_23815:220-1509(+)
MPSKLSALVVLLVVSASSSAASSSSHGKSAASRPFVTDARRRRHGSALPPAAAKLLSTVNRGGSDSPLAPPTAVVDAAVSTEAVQPPAKPVPLSPPSGGSTEAATMVDSKSGGVELPPAVKLIIGAGGIYGAFLYYGSLQEDVFRYQSADGSSFKQAWFLQVLEALANVVIGFAGMQLSGPTTGIPMQMFAISGASQVTAKACTSLALANGLSFPVATLAKSGKMAPVMAGSVLLGSASYSTREYLQVAAIIGGTAIVSMGKKKGGGSASTSMGVFYIVMSLVLDGVTAGFQKRLKAETAKAGVKPKPYDFMFWTNLYMCLTAAVIALALGELTSGLAFCSSNPEIYSKIIKFAVCSAVGQSFIFYTIANFDPLILSTVTTTRKIFSVLLSIFLKGHSLSGMGWSGIGLACGGILSEMQAKMSGKKKGH